jgi:hypothetical protein
LWYHYKHTHNESHDDWAKIGVNVIFIIFLPKIAIFYKYHAETLWKDLIYQQTNFNTIESKLGQKWEHDEKIKRNP